MSTQTYVLGFLSGSRRADIAEIAHLSRVGRDATCEIKLDPHEDLGASRLHAQFAVDADGVHILDSGSRGGTLVNGKVIEQHKLFPLYEGDLIRFGATGPYAVFNRLRSLQKAKTLVLRVTRLDNVEKPVWSFSINHSQFLTFGRAPKNHVPFPDDKDVSRYHLSLHVLFNKIVVEDMGSANGSFLNGQALQVDLANPGDTVELGRMGPRLRLELATEGGFKESAEIEPLGQSWPAVEDTKSSWIEEGSSAKITMVFNPAHAQGKVDHKLDRQIHLNNQKQADLEQLLIHDRTMDGCPCTSNDSHFLHLYWQHRQDIVDQLLNLKEYVYEDLPELQIPHRDGILRDQTVGLSEADLLDIANWYIGTKAFQSVKGYNDNADKRAPNPHNAPIVESSLIELTEARPLRKKLIQSRDFFAREINRIRAAISKKVQRLQSHGEAVDLHELGEWILQLSENTARHKLVEELTGEIIRDITTSRAVTMNLQEFSARAVRNMDEDQAHVFFIGYHTATLDIFEFNKGGRIFGSPKRRQKPES